MLGQGMRLVAAGMLAAAIAGCSGGGSESASATPGGEGGGEKAAQGESASMPESIHAFTMTRIDGSAEPLSAYEGKVVLVVNVASKCGLTPQYAGLEALYEEKKDEGLVVLGFPANNFMGQEPGTNEEIAHFCTNEYGVTFPMFEKISVKGEDQHPLYRMLSSQSEEPSWNFTKYLVGPDGRLVRRFGPRTKPDDAALMAEVDRLLEAG